MKIALTLLAGLCLASAPALAQTAPPASPPSAVAPPVADPLRPPGVLRRMQAATRTLVLANGQLSGPGADFLREQTARSQFVLLGESHNDRDIPGFALGLYRMLADAHGFDRLVVENDPMAMQTVDASRGDLDAVVAFARRYPDQIGFASDQDLRLYAAVAAASRPEAPAIWGIEQAQGAARYLEELETLAPAALKPEIAALLADARAKDAFPVLGFMHDDPETTPRLERLAQAWSPAPGSRAARLLGDLIRSTVIYGYDRRANAGEPVGLFNNTDREQLFRENFIRAYRADAVHGRTPKALFKMGQWHLYRGMSPGNAFTIGNFAHEFAIANGAEAYGIFMVPVGSDAASLADYPHWMQPLLPAQLPDGPVVIDLRSLQVWATAFSRLLPEGERADLVRLMRGYDALVILPRSGPATFDLTGIPPR